MTPRPSVDAPPPADWTGDDLPREGRLLGVDFGTKRLGLAVSTPEQNLSTPLDTWVRAGPAIEARRLRELLEDYPVVGCVVGLPLHMNGDEGESARQAREFGRWLRGAIGRPTAFYDERCSSAAADDWMLAADLSRDKRRGLRDRLAAHVILQSYLDARRPRPASPAEEE